MNGVVLVTCAIVILAVAYRFYGKWLAKTWGIDPNALTPAHRLEDGQDYTPSSKFTVFAISSRPLPVPALSRVRLSPPRTAGCRPSYGL